MSEISMVDTESEDTKSIAALATALMEKQAKQKGKTKDKDKEKDKKKKHGQSPKASSPQGEQDERNNGFTFHFTSISNLVLSSYPVEVVISLFFDDALVESTPPISIESKRPQELKHSLYYKVKDVKQFSVIDKLISTPFIIVLSVSGKKEDQSEKKKTQKKKRRKTSVDATASLALKGLTGTIAGQTTLDIITLLLGGDYHKEVLTLEPNLAVIETTVPFSSKTQLTVVCEPLGTTMRVVKSELQFRNMLTFTIRALYNAQLPELTENCYCIAVAPLLHRYPTDEEEEELEEDDNSSQESIPSYYSALKKPYTLMVFEPGKLEKDMDYTGLKRWSTCMLVNGGIAYTKEKLFDDFMSVKNKIKVDISSKEYSEEPRVYWNMSRRTILTSDTNEAMYKMILKYRVWPVEIVISAAGNPGISGQAQKDTTAEKGKPGSKRKQTVQTKQKPTKSDIKHYVAFFDLGDLLYPGIKSTVVTAQLYTFCKSYVEMKWGYQEPLMKDWLQTTEAPSKPGKSDHKSSESVLTLKGKAAAAEKEPEKAVPVFSNKGEPVFLVIDVGLAKPFVKKKKFEEINESIKELLPARKPFDESDIGFIAVSRNNFKNCIRNLAGVVSKEYQDFKTLQNHESCPYNDEDEIDFYEHLQRSGAQQMMTETLRIPLTRYVSEVIGVPSTQDKSIDIQEYLTQIYSQLVQDMNIIVNECDIKSRLKIGSPAADIALETYLIMAAEADAESKPSKCKYYMLKRLESNISNPQLWLDVAVPLLNYKQYNAALEIIREVLFLDSRNREALLMYGAIMTITGQLELAELFFDALTRIYPLFIEGWVAFFVFYCIIGRQEGADVTLGIANKCEILLEFSTQNLSRFPPINWTVKFRRTADDLLLRSAIYMLSLNLHTFVEVCMGEILSETEYETKAYHYYLAACHYQQKRYRDSLKHLERLRSLKWNDSNLWSLIGNNYYSLKKHKLAKRAYTMAIETARSSNTSLSTLLSFVRMGFYKLADHKYEEAFFLFKSIVSKYPTAKAWCGLGVACYRLNLPSDAELALTESNILDTQCSLTWAYLALINGVRKNINNFEQCTRIAIEKGLRASELVKELWKMWQNLIGVTSGRSKFKAVQ